MAGCKINTQKSIVFVYTENTMDEKQLLRSIPFTIATEKIKYLGKYLTKEVKDVYDENCNTLTE